MKTTKNRLLIGLQLAILLILVMGCSTLIPDNNMKWTAQYDFIDLYKKRNNGFNPGSDKELSVVFSPTENIIVLGAQKNTHRFDPTITEDYSSYNTPLSLQKVENENDEEKEIITIYDLEENFVRKITKENREKYYYYKDFICDYTNLHSRGNTLRFSFDKGKTWKTHHIPMAGLLVFNKNVGFFEDKYIIFEGILFRGASSGSGDRILVGEFQR